MSISTRITSMEQHIGNAYDKLDELGVDLTNVDKNLNNIAELLDGVYEEYPKIEETNVIEPNISGTKAGKMEINLKGNTDQTTYTGKNLFKSIASSIKAGITFTNNGDGSYTIDGTSTTSTSFYVTGLGYSSGTYSLSANNSVINSNIIVQIETTNGTKMMVLDAINRTLTAECGTINALSIVIRDVASFNNFKFYPQLETGSTATSFEPYTGGTASPNPGYPQDVEVVSGENTVKVVNKNLLEIPNGTYSKNGIDVSIVNGVISINGTATGTSNTSISISNYKLSKPGTYTISCNTDISSYGNNLQLGGYVYNADGTYKTNLDIRNANKTQTISNGEYISNFWIYIYKNTTINNIQVSVQLEENSTATTYEEHKEQDFPISLSSRNLFDKNTTISDYRLDPQCNVFLDANSFLTDYIPVKPNTSYTGNTVFTNAYNRIGFYDKNKNVLSSNEGGDSYTITTPNNSNLAYMRFGKQKEQLDTFMLVEGTTVPTSYQPYYNYELCKIGDYKDYPWKDESTGKWYIHKEFQKIVFDNDSQILTGSSSTDGYARVGYGPETDIGWKSNSILGVYCNKFKGVIQNENTPSITGQHWYISNTSVNGFRILFRSGDLSLNGSQLATLIKTSGIYIYCFRKTPIEIEITDTTLINQLEAIYNTAKSYDDTTNIIQENNNLPFILDIKTLKKS